MILFTAMNPVYFLSGIFMTTFAASGLFFLKFYRASGDRFFAYFCGACWLIAIERVVLLFNADLTQNLQNAPSESASFVYLIRLAAYGLILGGIIHKNR